MTATAHQKLASNHNKIINVAARKELKPLGLKRKGSSRIWIDDHGWWLIQVEFQPVSFGKGSYLNVGIGWLLIEKGYVSFDIGYRIDTPFIEYKTDEQFEPEIEKLAKRAAVEVSKLRHDFESLKLAADYYRNTELKKSSECYYAGVILGLAGAAKESRKYLEQVAKLDQKSGWRKGLAYKARDLLHLLGNSTQFADSITGTVHRARSTANLDDWEGELSF